MKKEALWKFPITAVCETLAKKKFNELVRRFEKISEGHQQKPNWSGQNGFFEKRRSIYRASRFSVGINKAPSMSMHGKELPRIYPARIIIVLVVPCELGVDYWSPLLPESFLTVMCFSECVRVCMGWHVYLEQQYLYLGRKSEKMGCNVTNPTLDFVGSIQPALISNLECTFCSEYVCGRQRR